MKIGLNLKIDVTKIDKQHLYVGEKGKYLDATIFVDLDNPDKYGNHGMVTQSGQNIANKEGAILGNGRIFWRDNQRAPQQPQNAPNQNGQQGYQNQQKTPQGAAQGQPEPDFDFDDYEIPFN